MSKFFWALLLAVSGPVFSHGGGLNAEGCHNNRKTGDYHCHRGSAATPAPQAHVQNGTAQRFSAPVPDRPTCYTGPRGGTYTITKSGRKNYKGC